MRKGCLRETAYKDDKWHVFRYATGIIQGEYNDSFILPPDCEITIEHENELEKQLKRAANNALKPYTDKYITEVDFNLLSTIKNRQTDYVFFCVQFYCPEGKNEVEDLCISVRDATLQVLNADGFIEK